MSDVRVALLPTAIQNRDLSGSIAVVIDVLRATTTIIHALAASAESVIPCSEVDDAFAIRDRLGSDRCVLGGERHGLLIKGFQLDNSPFAYTPEAVGGKTVVFTTTNGTRALAAARGADRILIGGFVNRTALCEALRRDGRPVWLVCAGTDGFVTAEDVLFAGSVARGLSAHRESAAGDAHPTVADVESIDPTRGDATEMAIRFYTGCGRNAETRLSAMRESRGGQNLIENHFDRDIARAAEDSLPRLDIVPEWRDCRITV